MGTKKNFVLDTNVILHDSNCLKNFQENDIYLPLVVLEELDKFKKGNERKGVLLTYYRGGIAVRRLPGRIIHLSSSD